MYYRPMVIHSVTKKWIQAWPFLNSDKSYYELDTVPRCVSCKVKAATRKCQDCLDDIGLYYCFTCWVDFHHRKIELRFHKYSIVHRTKKKYDPSSWQCCFCDEPATRKCYGIVIPESTYELISQQKK